MNWWSHIRARIGRFMHQKFLERTARSLGAQVEVYEGSVRMPWMTIGTGDRPTLVFLHGFSDRKEGFLFAARFLSRHVNLIVPDLPGFGEASQEDHLTYDIRHYQKWVGEWLDQIPVARFHLMGNSLGGAIATEVAETHRDRIQSLCLIGSAGFLLQGHNQAYEEFLRGENFFLVKNWEDYLKFNARVFHKSPEIPKWVQLYLAEEAITKRLWYERIFVDMLPVK
ncbi:MAG: alpha/beta fold hydrolase, partial [Bacteroidota bacterium]